MRSWIFLVFLLGVLLLSCSNSSSPIVPKTVLSPSLSERSGSTNRFVWGMWDILISDDRTSVEVAPLRGLDMHLNVVKLLEVAPCADCIKIGNITKVGPNEIDVDVTLRHPFPGLLKYTGFDVRGIFISQGNYQFQSGRTMAWGDTAPCLENYDGYTSLFNPTEFPQTTPAALGYIPGKKASGGNLTSTLNPFIAYKKDAPRRMFEAGGQETKTFRIKSPSGPFHFGYAVDACWQLVDTVIDPLTDFPPDANCLESYRMDATIGTEFLEGENCELPFQVQIYDHQGRDTISSVTIEAPDLFTGESALSFSNVMPDGSFLFTGTLTNNHGVSAGTYPVLITATDTQADQNMGNIAAWQILSATVRIPKGWARTWGGTELTEGFSIAIDGSGNAYITGYFQGTVDFDPGPGLDNHTSNGDDDVFLSKFDPNGNFIWSRSWGGLELDMGYAVAVDGSGNAYVTGRFLGTVDFDPGPGVDNHTAIGGWNTFLSKLDSNGNFVWARTWGGEPDSHMNGFSVAIDIFGCVYVTGEFGDRTADFDPGPGVDNHTSNGDGDAFLSKFDSNGIFVWARTWGGSVWDQGRSVHVSANALI